MTGKRKRAAPAPGREPTLKDLVAWEVCAFANKTCECRKERTRGSCEALALPASSVIRIVKEEADREFAVDVLDALSEALGGRGGRP